MVYSTDRSKAVVPVLVLLFVAFGLFYEAIWFMSYLVSFCFSVLLAMPLPPFWCRLGVGLTGVGGGCCGL